MILVDTEIEDGLFSGDIVIKPYDPVCLGTNSYDVHLSKYIKCYVFGRLDAKIEPETIDIEIPDEGITMFPGTIYLASTIEYTETWNAVPFLEGKSSVGRLGINVHATAGKGDVGFCNHWTMELSCIQPVTIYAGMPIAQLIYHKISKKPAIFYGIKKSAKYADPDPKPQESRMYLNFKKGE